MKVSIITTSFNSAATINDTLQSVATQTYANIEHIIIDGKSTDDTIAIVNKYPHIAKVISETDKGIYDAMNKGIVNATGDVIGILNSDDFYTDNSVITDIVDMLNKKKVDGVYANLYYVDNKNTDKIIRRWISGNYNYKSFYYGWMPPHPTIFVKKEVYLKCGSFNTVMKSAADYEFIIRAFIVNKCKFCYLNRVIVKMRIGGVSSGTIKNRLRANKEDRLAWRMNNLSPNFFTLLLKPIRKITQYI